MQEIIGFEAVGQRDSRLAHIALSLAHRQQRCPAREVEHDRFDQAAQRGPERLIVFEYPLLRVAHVAAEEFVAAVTGEQHLDAMFPREPGAEVRRYRRRIAERLVICAGNQRHGLGDMFRGHVELLGLGAEVPRGDACILQLVEALRVEADRKGACRATADFAEQSGHRRAVGAAGKECTGRPLIDLASHGLPQQVPEGFFLCSRGGSGCGFEAHCPVEVARRVVRGRDKPLRWQQLLDAGECRTRARYHVAVEIVIERLVAHPRTDGRVPCDGARAGRKDQQRTDARETHALHPRPVYRQHDAPLSEVDQHQREAPEQVREHAIAVLAVTRNRGGRVAAVVRERRRRVLAPAWPAEDGDGALRRGVVFDPTRRRTRRDPACARQIQHASRLDGAFGAEHRFQRLGRDVVSAPEVCPSAQNSVGFHRFGSSRLIGAAAMVADDMRGKCGATRAACLRACAGSAA
ncbi:Uncharacterized protein pbN1_28040 [Aromatoleum bremense]|nr:Uncharacterized protein pbN1_28040 [Aromatoleum bremense]